MNMKIKGLKASCSFFKFYKWYIIKHNRSSNYLYFRLYQETPWNTVVIPFSSKNTSLLINHDQ